MYTNLLLIIGNTFYSFYFIMEVRVSRIIAEYYDYTRREAEDYIRQGRVTVNGQKIQIGDKAGAADIVALDDVSIPLKGIFRRLERQELGRSEAGKGKQFRQEDERYEDPKSRELRKGRKKHCRTRSKADEYEEDAYDD